MKFIFPILILFAVLYAHQVIVGLRKIKMTHDLIVIFNKAFETKDIAECRKNLIPQMPKLKYLNPSYPIDALNYEMSDYVFQDNVKVIYSHLFTIQDYLLFDKWQIFNPFTPLKGVFLIPSNILNFLGLNLNGIISAIINAVTWSVIYHKNIKSVYTILKPFFEKFFQ